MADFPTPRFFQAPVRGMPYNFGMKLTPQKLPYGESFIILTSTVFVWSTRVTDGQTDDSALSMLYVVAR